ncbi:hypothetical protein SAMN05216358_0054 [Rhizobium sp. AN5]|uniref:hypothetical protein n=1 Tax=Rhizobium sp. AN5 TaxID=1855304 RepID=UPI000BD38B22|nr:hypothetical protein [Rhizobium sp. AN5]SOC90035.1 hypothetical protein SAMN05216358_0054 [Rhizobium sp. AN5]
MPKYRITTTMILEADDEKQAAMKTFALHDTMTPEDYVVYGEDEIIGTDVFLEQDNKEEARRAYAAGEYFEEVDISQVKL